MALVDPTKGHFKTKAITSISPEVPWPGFWPRVECFRDPVPIARDCFLSLHAPPERFGIYVIDRFGHRELLHMDPAISSMGPTPLRAVVAPPVLPDTIFPKEDLGSFALVEVYRGLEPTVKRGNSKYPRFVEEVRHDIHDAPNRDHTDFMKWCASPVDVVSGHFGWPTYVAKAPLGIVLVETDGSAFFQAPAGQTLYFQALEADLNELQRMRSAVRLQPGEARSCVGCHEDRYSAPPIRPPMALRKPPVDLQPPTWGAGPFSYEEVVQPVLDKHCVSCHDAKHPEKLDLTGTLDAERIPASYRTMISRGMVHLVD